MKKINIILATLIACFCLSNVFAAAANEKSGTGFYSKRHPKPAITSGLSSKTAQVPTTYITINNNTPSKIIWEVRDDYNHNRVILSDFIDPYDNDHIQNDGRYMDTYLYVRGENGEPLVNGYVCRLGVINIGGYPGNYRVYINC